MIATPQPVAPGDVVARALAFVGQGRYELGAGAPFPARTPFAEADNPIPGHCDCSGFVAWCAKYKRGPWNTDGMVKDATRTARRFRLVPREAPVRPGDVIVYPGPDRDHDGERDAPGHCGIVVEVLPGFVRGKAEWWEHLRVAHCSRRHQDALGAIRITDATLWAGRGYLVRPTHYTDET
jgi:hypothetical protein